MKKMIKFTDIGQYRNIIHDMCYIPEGSIIKEFPIVEFIGTVKLHGTNSGVSYTPEEGMWVQSRQHIITTEKDNSGFAFFVEQNREWFETTLSKLYIDGYIITIFGEWCGGNIQKGVALNQLSKRFVQFALKYTNIENHEDHWYCKPIQFPSPEAIQSIYEERFPKYTITIDFNNPKLAQAKMVKMVKAVENECPYSKAFGVSGIGEGIVFTSFTEDGKRTAVFKVKGEKHSTSKVKTLAPVDIEKVNSINEFVEYAVTENRLNQGIEQVFTSNAELPIIQKMGAFLKWVMHDIMKEEMDVLIENKLEPKEIGSSVSNKARKWFMEYLDSLVM